MSIPTTRDELEAQFALLNAATRAILTPAQLVEVFADPTAHPVELLYALSLTWQSTADPLAHLPQSTWVEMFRRVGFFTVGADAMPRRVELPTRVVPLYRGSPADTQRGMWWTPDRAYAARYSPAVWTVEVPPTALLATFTNPFTGGLSVLVDIPAHADIQEARA